MKKQVNTAIAALFLATASMTATATEKESDYYIGVGGTTGSGTYSAGAVVGSFALNASVDYDTDSVPVKLGFYLDSGDRVEVQYQSMDASSPNLGQATISGFNVDYKLFFEEPKVGEFVPYGVAGIGLYEWENTAQYFTGGDNLEGVQWGVGAGGVYGIDETLELEVSAQYKKITWQDIMVGSTTISSDNSGSELYLGLNYKL